MTRSININEFINYIFASFQTEYALAVIRSIPYRIQRESGLLNWHNQHLVNASQSWGWIRGDRSDDEMLRRYVSFVNTHNKIFGDKHVAQCVVDAIQNNTVDVNKLSRWDMKELRFSSLVYAPAMGLMSRQLIKEDVLNGHIWACSTAMFYDIHEIDALDEQYQMIIDRFMKTNRAEFMKNRTLQYYDSLNFGLFKPVAISILNGQVLPDWLLNMYYRWCLHKSWPINNYGSSTYTWSFSRIFLKAFMKDIDMVYDRLSALGCNHRDVVNTIGVLADFGWDRDINLGNMPNKVYSKLVRQMLFSPALAKVMEAHDIA